MWFDPRPPVPITFVASAARTTSSNTGNLKDTSTGFPKFATGSVYLNVTANTATGGVVPKLTVSIDTSPDNGTTWLNAARFAVVVGSTDTRRLDFRNGLSIGETGTALNTTSGTLAGNTVLTRDVRVQWQLESASNTVGQSTTFAVYGLFKGSE